MTAHIDPHQYRQVPIQEDDPCCPTVPSVDPLSEKDAATLATAFKVLGDPVRLRLLSLIAGRDGGEACVCDILPSFAVSQPTISHHLKVLRDNGYVESERRGTWVYYRVVPSTLAPLAAALAELAPLVDMNAVTV